MKEGTAVVIANVLIVAIFAYVAIRFDTWWIVLLSCICTMTFKQ